MTDNQEIRAYLVSLEAYWAGAERGRNGGSAKNQPKPPNADAAWEVANLCANPLRYALITRRSATSPTTGSRRPRSSASRRKTFDG
jgi:hypothetical protein